jgi:hypothetical protein
MKQTITTVLFALACTQAFAAEQSVMNTNEKLKLVPSLGYTYFNIQGGDTAYESKGGSSAAVLIQMPMNADLELESGLEYIETGAKQSVSFGIFSFDTSNITIKNLAIPLRAKYSFNTTQAEGTHWYGKAGLTPTYVMAAELESMGTTQDIKSELNSFNILTQAGVGADWQVTMGGRVNVDFSYNYGLNKVSKNDNGRAAGFQLQAGYSIEL